MTGERIEDVQYSTALRDAVELWGQNHGETTEWARCALAALLGGHLSPEALARSVYDALKPVDAWGRRVAPKIRGGKLSVRNLENTIYPVTGSAAARSSLEAVLLIHSVREQLGPELAAFIGGHGRLYGLRRIAKGKLRKCDLAGL